MIFIDECDSISNNTNYLKISIKDTISYYEKQEHKNRTFMYKMINRQVEII